MFIKLISVLIQLVHVTIRSCFETKKQPQNDATIYKMWVANPSPFALVSSAVAPPILELLLQTVLPKRLIKDGKNEKEACPREQSRSRGETKKKKEKKIRGRNVLTSA